jgi:tryptophan-rich sensory protein
MNQLLIVTPLVLSQIVQRFTPMNKSWYNTIKRSTLEPPGWVFGVVWTILYLIIGYSLFLNKKGTEWLWASLLLGFVWLYVLNNLKSIRGGLVVLLLTVLTAFEYYRLSKNDLILPYLAWGLFASYLNLYMAMNN